MNDDNIIKFPQRKKEVQSEEDESFIETIWVNVLEDMRRAGYDFAKDPDKFFPSMVMIFESIRSLALMEKEKHHPLQDISKELFDYQSLPSDFDGIEIPDNFGEMTLDEMFEFLEKSSKENVDN